MGTTGISNRPRPSVYVADGVHVIDGSAPFGVSVSGWDSFDSYSYPGGLTQTLINPVE